MQDAADASTEEDASADAEPGDASAEASFDAHPGVLYDGGPRPNAVFMTSKAYTGDFVSEANALVASGKIPAPAGGAFTASQGQEAGDAICQYHADRVGLPGTYWVMTYQALFERGLTSADGPWALVDGTPVADTVNELIALHLHASIDVTELGTTPPFDPTWPAIFSWGNAPGDHCDGWSRTHDDAGVLFGSIGFARYTGASDAWGDDCTAEHSLRCVGVGPGASANVYPTEPNGAKRVFLAQGPYPANFAAGLGDAGADAAHAAADALCQAAADAESLSGTFRAFISTSARSAIEYFAELGMNGPWYRSDGFLVAATRADLVSGAGIQSQILLRADGQFGNAYQPVLTGTLANGSLSSNCDDFSVSASEQSVDSGYPRAKDLAWVSGTGLACSSSGSLYCFEE